MLDKILQLIHVEDLAEIDSVLSSAIVHLAPEICLDSMSRGERIEFAYEQLESDCIRYLLMAFRSKVREQILDQMGVEHLEDVDPASQTVEGVLKICLGDAYVPAFVRETVQVGEKDLEGSGLE